MRALKAFALCLIAILGIASSTPGASASEIQSTILYVKPGAAGDCSGWEQACDLQLALTQANGGDQVWVAAGTYKPTTGTDRATSFELIPNVALYGGFPEGGGDWRSRDPLNNVTTLSGDIGTSGLTDDNSFRVVVGIGVGVATIVDGFTITAGNANGNFPDDIGGGMFNTNNSSPTLRNIIFTGNSALYCGGLGNNDNSNPTLTNILFFGNTAEWGGGMCNSGGSNATMTSVTFSGNYASDYGGGLFNESSSPSLSKVTFSGNFAPYGGGMMNYVGSSPNLTNITFTGNFATYGGGLANALSSSPNLTNVTFYGNTASTAGGGMYNYSNSNPTLTNGIVWGNNNDQIFNETSTPTITFCDVMGGYFGDGNINQDPLLGPLANNGGLTMTHALGNGSPAIDTGSPSLCPGEDQRGFYRPTDGDGDGAARCDMGAYEFGSGFKLYLPFIVK